MTFFKDWSIRTKLELAFIIMLTLIGFFIGSFVIFNLKHGAEVRMESSRITELAKVKGTLAEGVDMAIQLVDRRRQNAEDPKYLEARYGPQLKGVIDVVHAMIMDELGNVKAGKISKEEAQKKMIEEVRRSRYDNGTGYVWINDTTRPFPKMIMHPTLPELDGKFMDDPKYNCALGRKENLFVAFVDVCEKQGEGYVDYLWPKPRKNGLTEDQPKLSYVRLISEWNWIIGTGIYVDDAKKDAMTESVDEIRQMRWASEDNYFWIMENTHPFPNVVMHPILPKIEGLPMDSERYNCVGKEKKNLGVAFLDVVQKTGQGFVEYTWPKPTDNGRMEDKPKIAFVKFYKPYNWLVASGVYVDDIEEAIVKKKDALQQEIYQSILTIILTLVVSLVAFKFLITFLTSKIIIRPLRKVTDIAHEISEGKLPAALSADSESEIGQLEKSFNKIIESTKNTVQQIQSISQGDYAISLQPRSEHDELSKALIRMTEALKDFYTEEKQQNWTKTGLTELNRYIHGEFDLEKLAQNSLSFLAHYLCMPVGTIFIEEDHRLRMIAYYALYASDQSSSIKTISFGESLIGQAAADKQPLIVHDVPESYFTVQSGLGHAAPKNLIILPLMYENEVVGMLELGTFEPLNNYQFDFLRQAADQIAISFFSFKARIKQNSLFEETLIQSEKLLHTNQALEERAALLEKQRQEIDRQNLILKNTAINLQKATRDLEISSKYKSEFLANMSHELRTPLNSLLILSKLLMENKDGNLNTKQIEFAQTINQSGAHLLRLINDILDLAKVEAGKMQLHIEDVRITDICSQVEKIFEHVAKEKGLEFKVIQEEGIPENIRSDGQRILQVLLNLLSNAFKFTKEGSVVLRVSKPVNSECTCIKDAAIIFEVKDTGIGIPDGKQELIFQAFQQADGSTSRKYGGTGLGLSISKEFIRLLGGGIRLQSKANEGCTFTICLPAVCSETNIVDNKKESGSSADIEKEDRSLNCWEFMKCGREAGGTHVSQLGICPAYPDHGHTCMEVPGTLCRGKVEGLEDLKEKECEKCKFFRYKFNFKEEGILLTSKDSLEKVTKSSAIPDDFSLADKKILIVDDDMRNAYALTAAFEEKSVRSVLAVSGKAAIERLEQHSDIDLILMDIMMPEMDGYEAIRQIRQRAKFKQLPIIALTSKNLSDEKEKCIAAGADDYFAKPIDIEKLFSLIKRFLGVPKEAAKLETEIR